MLEKTVNPKRFFLGTDQMSMASLLRIAVATEALEASRNDRERRSQFMAEVRHEALLLQQGLLFRTEIPMVISRWSLACKMATGPTHLLG